MRRQRALDLFDPAGSSNDSDEWYTPEWIFRALAVEFEMDPCSPGAPPSQVPARIHITKTQNGLLMPWRGSVWLNPPFTAKQEWYERMIGHGDGIALVPARTEVAGVQRMLEHASAALFMRGRVYFHRGAGLPANGSRGMSTSPPFGIILVAFGHAMAQALMASEIQGYKVESRAGERPAAWMQPPVEGVSRAAGRRAARPAPR